MTYQRDECAIESVLAWEALDSRGTPTVGCEVRLAGGATGAVVVPSGASTGRHEAREMRDGGERYGGRGVAAAVESVTARIAPALRGTDAADQNAVDSLMVEIDGTANFSELGANAVLAVSLACPLAVASQLRKPLYQILAAAEEAPLLPLPMVNIISGGAHAGWSMDVQDLLVVPVGAGSFSQAIEWAWRVRRAAAALVDERGLTAALVADEGGLGPALNSARDGLEILVAAIERAGLEPGAEVAIAIDIAASQLVSEGSYRFGGSLTDAQSVVDTIVDWARDFPLVSVEDPLGEDDWDGWRLASERLTGIQLLGDDLFVTNSDRLERGSVESIANAILVKPNQNGTVSGARKVVEQARRSGYATVLSARSGETEDSWLADMAVAWRTGQIKVGSTTRSERTAKWNRVLRIEAELGEEAAFAGAGALAAGPARAADR